MEEPVESITPTNQKSLNPQPAPLSNVNQASQAQSAQNPQTKFFNISSTSPQKESSIHEREPGSIRLRFAAIFFDNLILGVPINILTVLSWQILGFTFYNTTNSANIFLLIIFFLSMLTYYIYFSVKSGATPGKNIYGLKIIDIDTNNNLTYKKSTIRELINRGILSIPLLGFLFGIINFFVILSKPERRGVHDKAAHSQVIKSEASWSILKQLGLFFLLLILNIAPFILMVPKFMNQAQELNSCVQQCVETKASIGESEQSFQNTSEICLQECSI